MRRPQIDEQHCPQCDPDGSNTPITYTHALLGEAYDGDGEKVVFNCPDCEFEWSLVYDPQTA